MKSMAGNTSHLLNSCIGDGEVLAKHWSALKRKSIWEMIKNISWIWTSGEQKTYRSIIPNSTDTDIDLQRGSPLIHLVD